MASSANMDAEVKRVIAFWFNRPPIEWIIAPDGLDEQMKHEFGDLVTKARQNELDDWATEPEASVALVAMLDSFSRNIYRGTSDAFTADTKAWETASKAIARDFDKQVTVMQATALYMPMMNRESLVSLIATRCLFQQLKPRCATDEEHEWVDMGISASKRHIAQLDRFGRYPTRNALLGRRSTPEEEEFLREHKPIL